MPWYRAIDDSTATRDHFEATWHAHGGPTDAALFGIRDPRHMKFEYYFSPEAALLDPDLVRRVAHPCDAPDISGRGLFLLVGDQLSAGKYYVQV
jgi:hypothetical protein